MISVFGYLYDWVATGLLNAKASVNIPTRPINIDDIISHLPDSDKSAVIPVDSPTVQKAEITSNDSAINSLCGSKSVRINMATIL